MCSACYTRPNHIARIILHTGVCRIDGYGSRPVPFITHAVIIISNVFHFVRENVNPTRFLRNLKCMHSIPGNIILFTYRQLQFQDASLNFKFRKKSLPSKKQPKSNKLTTQHKESTKNLFKKAALTFRCGGSDSQTIRGAKRKSESEIQFPPSWH